jgi:hypothetical protein
MADVGSKIIDRFVAIHRADCELLTTPVAEPPIADVGDTLSDEEAVKLRRPFDELRRLIGQVAGLLLLAEVSGRREIVEISSLALAKQKFAEVQTQFEDAKIWLRHSPTLHAFGQTISHITFCMTALANATERRGFFDIQEAQRRISIAYRFLQSTTDAAHGRNMVDFNQACCSCQGASPKQIKTITGR